MRTIILAAFVQALLASGARAQDVPPPPPLVDYAEASYVGLSYVAVCAPARTYTIVLASPFGGGPQVRTLDLGGKPALADDLARWNIRLAELKSFSGLTILCATSGDIIRIDGYAKAATSAGTRRVEATLSDGRVIIN